MDGSGTIVSQPPLVDIVILEGWCVGFQAISSDDLYRRWNGIWKEEREKLSLTEDKVGKKIDVENVNEKLKGYASLWTFFDIFVQLKATPPPSTSESQHSIIYEWRLEQERYMKEQNGGRGMSDAAVKSFVDRYIPGYVFFGDSSPLSVDQGQKTLGRTLTLYLDAMRNVTTSSTS